MKQRYFHLIFSIAISTLILAPAGYRLFVTIFPEPEYPVAVHPLPALQAWNIKNGQGIKGKIKGIYMDLSLNLNQYDDWYKTGFTFRSELLELYKTIKTDIFHAQPFPDKVILGRGDWMFTGDRFDGSLSEQLGYNRMTSEEINDLADMIAAFQKWCEGQDIFYVFMPTWGKAGLYSDSIPMKPADTPSTLNALNHVLISKGVRVLDSRRQLEKHRSKTLFFKHDSHWNGHGAWIAYRQLMDTLQTFNPDLPGLTAEDVTADTIFPGDMDIAKLLGIKSPYPSIYVRPKIRRTQQVENRLSLPENYTYVPPENYEKRFRNDSAEQKLLVFRDSYFVHLKPLLTESFKESVLIWHRIPDTTLILQEQPDILIQQISERLINDMYFEIKSKAAQK